MRKRTFVVLVAFWLLLKTEHMGKPWNNESAEKWWACGRHVRQKELAPSAKVQKTRTRAIATYATNEPQYATWLLVLDTS